MLQVNTGTRSCQNHTGVSVDRGYEMNAVGGGAGRASWCRARDSSASTLDARMVGGGTRAWPALDKDELRTGTTTKSDSLESILRCIQIPQPRLTNVRLFRFHSLGLKDAKFEGLVGYCAEACGGYCAECPFV